MNERSIELIFQSLGAASMCWTGAPSGTFDSSRCKEIGNELIAALDVESQKPSHNRPKVPCYFCVDLLSDIGLHFCKACGRKLP